MIGTVDLARAAFCLAPATGLALATGVQQEPARSHAAEQTTQQAVQSAAQPPRAFDHAVLISVDGLRSDALIALPRAELPGFARLRSGASTLNARTDADFTVTLPNHTGMITGRSTLGDDGHGWTENVDPPSGATLHRNKGAYVAGAFDVAHDRGLRTALFSGKTKFSLYDVSWNGEFGEADVTGSDEGRDKIDEYACVAEPKEVAEKAIRFLGTGEFRSFAFVHFALTDHVGHVSGWDVTPGSPYMRALAAIDGEIGRILDAAGAQDGLRGKTVVVLTADHGGGAPFRSHEQPWMWVDYIIPFIVWTGDVTQPGEGQELYTLNTPTRRDPGLSQPPRAIAQAADSALPPIRNGDAGNLVLGLLGLPPVPGSTINAKQDLAVAPAR